MWLVLASTAAAWQIGAFAACPNQYPPGQCPYNCAGKTTTCLGLYCYKAPAGDPFPCCCTRSTPFGCCQYVCEPVKCLPYMCMPMFSCDIVPLESLNDYYCSDPPGTCVPGGNNMMMDSDGETL